jgi:uncharacterized protein
MNLLFTDALKLRGPAAFSIMVKPVGSSCNLNCTYCYYLEKKHLYGPGKDLRLNECLLEEFIKKYIEALEVPSVTFVWQGGEPTLLGLDYFRNALAFQKKYSNGKTIENSFQTNGTLLTDEWCKFFSDNNILVGISIDGEEHNHDHFRRTPADGPTFSRVMKGIELLHKNHAEFNTLSCVNNYNVNYASETYRFLKRIGSGFIQFLPVVERKALQQQRNGLNLVSPGFPDDAAVTDWSVPAEKFGEFLITIFNEWVRNDVARYYVQIFDATLANYTGEMPGLCVFSETCGDALVMEHNGDLYSCDHFVYPEYFLGNLSERSLAGLARSQPQFDFGIAKRNQLPDYCLQCEIRYACHGECPKHRFLLSPEGQGGLNYLCKGYKMFFKHAEPFMEFMAKELKSKRAPANVMNWVRNRENQAVRKPLPERNDPCPCGSGKKFKNCCSDNPIYRGR